VVLLVVAAVVPTVRTWLADRAAHRPSQLTAPAIAALVFTTSYQLYPEQGVVLGVLGAALVTVTRGRPSIAADPARTAS
jgi:hypothetical protein